MYRYLLVIITAGSFAANGFTQDIECNLTISNDTYLPIPAANKPGYLQSVTDPTFGTTITRIVGDPGDPVPDVDGVVWADEQERHGYSKRSVWNCDQSMMYLNRHSPNLWLDGTTYAPLFTRSKPSSYVLWSHTEPDIMYHTGKSGNCHIGKWDVIKDSSTELIDLRAYTSCQFGEGEGNFTLDGTRAAINGTRLSDDKEVVFVVDVANNTKGPDIEIDGITLKNCTISPRGTYVIIVHDSDRLRVLDADDGRLIWGETEYGLPSHFDVQVDQDGDEVVVGVGKTAPYSGLLIKRKLSDGTITALTESGYASHTSGRNLNRPGWVFVTYSNLDANSKYLPFINEMVAVKLDGARIERICNLRVDKKALPSADQYYFEAHGCPSPDGLRVVFASDWNAAAYPVQAYVVDFRDKVIPASVTDAGDDLKSSGLINLQRYPHPFITGTDIRFTVQADGRAVLKVYDTAGNDAVTVFDASVRAGKQYAVPFDASDLPDGIYTMRLTSRGRSATRIMILCK